MRHAVLGLVVWMALGCTKDKPEAAATGSAAGSAAGSATSTSAGSGAASGAGPVAAAVPSDAAPAPPDAAPLLGDLPPLAIADVDDATIERSSKLNNEAYLAHKKKDWAAAEAGYVAAVKADPGNLRARYNLACVYSSSDQADKAFAVLAQFEQPGCRACDAVLVKARTDHEWAARTADPRFVAIQERVAPTPTDLKAVTKLVIRAVRTGKTDGLEPYIHPRIPFRTRMIVYGPEQARWEQRYGWRGLVDFVGKGLRSLEDNGVARCAKNCCSTGARGDESLVVDHVCFEGAGDVLFVSEVELDPGPV